jgi:hypothetical protein
MASKTLERLFLDRMMNDLGWSAHAIDGDEPPDFYIAMGERRVAVEVTRIYRNEHPAKGSPEAAQEREYHLFASEIAEAYYADPKARAIQVKIALPPIINSPAVRQFSRKERKEDINDVAQRTLARLRHLPKLQPWARHRFQVRQRDGRPATFHILALPADTGAERRWDVVNVSMGWRGYVNAALLQAKVRAKSLDLKKYKDRVASAVLLVVADDMRASGFLELPSGIAVDRLGFDAIYFQRYLDGTQEVPPVAGT